MGRDKAGLAWGQTTLLGHVVSVVAGAVDEVVVAAGPQQELPGLPGEMVVARDPEPGLGPLRGLVTGLGAVGQAGPVVVVAVDQPFLRTPAIQALIGAVGEADVAAPLVDGVLRPLPACYRATLRPRAEGLLAAGERRLRALLDGSRVVSVPVDDLGGRDALADLDTAAAYEWSRARK
jgi:molybdopterin-guanine dinucleotide biosynthesis protein A